MKPIKFYTNKMLAYFLTKLYCNFWKLMSEDTYKKLSHMALVASYRAFVALNGDELPDKSVPILKHLADKFWLEPIDYITLYLMRQQFNKVVLDRYPDTDIFRLAISLKCDGTDISFVGSDEYTITLLEKIYKDDYETYIKVAC